MTALEELYQVATTKKKRGQQVISVDYVIQRVQEALTASQK